MAEASVVQNELRGQLAKAHLLAKSAFNRGYSAFWQTDVKPCADDMGWKLLEVFRSKVEEFRFKRKYVERGVKEAAWEIFRLALVGAADYSFDDVMAFVRWYGMLKGQISMAIGHFYEFHGDSFGDLVDAYPLAGRALVERALASHHRSDRPRREGYLDEREVTEAVLEALGLEWHKLICQGENYVASALESACYKCFLHRVLTGEDEQIAWTEEEKGGLSFAVHFDA